MAFINTTKGVIVMLKITIQYTGYSMNNRLEEVSVDRYLHLIENEVLEVVDSIYDATGRYKTCFERNTGKLYGVEHSSNNGTSIIQNIFKTFDIGNNKLAYEYNLNITSTEEI